MTLAAWQAQITTSTGATLLIGAGTSYRWAVMPTGFGIPELEAPRGKAAGVDGQFATGPDTVLNRFVEFDLHILGDTIADLETKANALKAAFAPTRTGTVTLELRLGGSTGYIIRGRPAGCEIDLRLHPQGSVARALVRFSGLDPRLLDEAVAAYLLTIPLPGAGLTFNATANFNFGGGDVGQTSVVNIGDGVDADWTITLVGPLTDPAIGHIETSTTLDLTGSIAAGETLVLDSYTKSVLLNGTSSRYSWLSDTSRWFTLAPGANTLTLRATGSGSGVISFRSARL